MIVHLFFSFFLKKIASCKVSLFKNRERIRRENSTTKKKKGSGEGLVARGNLYTIG